MSTAESLPLPAWYLKRALPRLAEIDRLTPRCNWDSSCPTWEQQVARDAWRRLMRDQADDEVAAGL
jgi:hypothetical protein